MVIWKFLFPGLHFSRPNNQINFQSTICLTSFATQLVTSVTYRRSNALVFRTFGFAYDGISHRFFSRKTELNNECGDSR